MTYARKTLSEIKLIHGNYGNFIKGQKLQKDKEKKYKTPPYQDLAASTEIDGETLNEKCWPGYEKKGMKTMFGKRYPNCVKKKKTKKEEFSDWRSELEQIEEKKMTKAQIKKRDEIADAISTKDMKDRYGDKNVKYAIATKLAMKEDNIQEILDKKDVPHVKKLVKKLRDGSKTHAKQADDLEVALKTEDTAIESELVIQDWNSDDIKFTEIETVDIIKAKPLKENADLEEGIKRKIVKKLVNKVIKKIKKEPVKYSVDKALSQKVQLQSIKNQAKYPSQFGKQINKGNTPVKVDLSKPINFDKYIGTTKPKKSIKKFGSERPTGTFTDDLPPVQNKPLTKKQLKKIKPKKPLKDHFNWREELDEGMAGALVKGGSKLIPALMTGIGAAGTIMQSKKKETTDDEDAENLFSEVEKMMKKKNPSTGNYNRAQRRIAELKDKLRRNADKRRMEKSYKKPASDKNEHYDWRDDLDEDWQKVNRKDKTDGMSKAAVKAYRKENPGSKLKTAVTKDPKKLKKGSKSAKRRLAFCRRMKGMKKKLTSAKTRRDPDSRINKALRRWNC